ncbi:MAG: AcrR family transcriptional regulator [Halieaceae bacterium]|jgi:AcrR family transcriptional regulator
MPALSKRDIIVASALKLFYQHGFNATGIERIIKEAGVSKKTLYNHFKSKDELILAALRQRDELFRNNLMRETERLGNTPRERLLSIFDVHHRWFQQNDFSGCMFINAAAEFSSHQDPNHIVSAEHKRLVRDYIRGLAEQAGASDAEALSKQLNLLLEGAIVDAHVSGNIEAATIAKAMASVFIEKALDEPTDLVPAT